MVMVMLLDGLKKYPPEVSLTCPLKSYLPNRKVVFQPPFLRGELFVLGRGHTFAIQVPCLYSST